jgi:hypothetical protein
MAVYLITPPAAAGLLAPGTNVDVVGAYAHNILVAKSLLPTLHLLEVTLRNNLSKARRRRTAGRARIASSLMMPLLLPLLPRWGVAPEFLSSC